MYNPEQLEQLASIASNLLELQQTPDKRITLRVFRRDVDVLIRLRLLPVWDDAATSYMLPDTRRALGKIIRPSKLLEKAMVVFYGGIMETEIESSVYLKLVGGLVEEAEAQARGSLTPLEEP